MRRLSGLIFLVLTVVGGYYFLKAWRATTPWGVGTGNIGGKSSDMGEGAGQSSGSKTLLAQIAADPAKFSGKRFTITGRVRGATKYASNRNIYSLVDNSDSRILVIDDKPQPPQEYFPRSVTGVLKVFKPPVGSAAYACLVDLNSSAQFDPPDWNVVKGFFSDKYHQAAQGVKEGLQQQ